MEDYQKWLQVYVRVLCKHSERRKIAELWEGLQMQEPVPSTLRTGLHTDRTAVGASAATGASLNPFERAIQAQQQGLGGQRSMQHANRRLGMGSAEEGHDVISFSPLPALHPSSGVAKMTPDNIVLGDGRQSMMMKMGSKIRQHMMQTLLKGLRASQSPQLQRLAALYEQALE